jgi:SAM-dependent methyltransferase
MSGLLTHAPVAYEALLRLRETLTGHSSRQTGLSTAPYCYAVWMRHLIQLYDFGPCPFPRTVVEIGPGSSLGVGLAALLSGVEQYYALDAVPHADLSRNGVILDDLLQMFLNQTPVPDPKSFPDLGPPLPSHAFPAHILSHVNAEESLAEGRLQQIRRDLQHLPEQDGNQRIFYLTGNRKDLPPPICGSVDWILSQFVMEHVDDLSGAYAKFYEILKPGGLMTHHIDFRAHWTAYEWNGYWTYEDWTWRLIRGKRPYFINRAPLSEHLSCLSRAGFDVLGVKGTEGPCDFPRDRLALRFRHLTDADLKTMTAMIAARRPS